MKAPTTPAVRRAVAAASLLLAALTTASPGDATAVSYPVVDTGQDACYDATASIACPPPGAPFHGQDAQHAGRQPDLATSADGLTVHDAVTGLTWTASPDTDGDGVVESGDDKLSWWDALALPDSLNARAFGGHDDWRLPSIKELYSLIDFRGIDPSGYTGGTAGLVPFIDTERFAFAYGDPDAGERIIDAQYWSGTEYVATTMNGDHTVFGVNFADGRIKGYGTSLHGSDKTAFVLCCRGDPAYGRNEFVDNGDGTVTDLATGLMWQRTDSGAGMTWEEALAYAEGLEHAGHDDWRLPDAKELQSIVDYTRSPATHGTAAIDPVFECTSIVDEGGGANFPFYWASTTHANWSLDAGAMAVYVCFGEALGWMQSPFPPYEYVLMDVHGAGAQRSDLKTGDPADWPYGHGPQGDVVRITNVVRCVRDAAGNTAVDDEEVPDAPEELRLGAVPNPFNPATTVVFAVPRGGPVRLTVHDLAGRCVRTLVRDRLAAGEHAVAWDGRTDAGRELPSGVYLARLSTGSSVRTLKTTLAR